MPINTRNLPLERRKITYLQAVILLIPIYWALGIEQLIWPVITTIFFISLPKIWSNSTVKLGVLLLVAYLISAFFIVEPIRYISFIRIFLVYLSSLFLFIYVIKVVREFYQLKRIIWGLSIFAFISSTLGLLAIIGIVKVNFNAPIQYLLPNFLKSTGMGQEYISQYLGHRAWFPGIGIFTRIKVFSIAATHYAAILIILIPLQAYLITQLRGWKRSFVITSVLMCLVNLFFTMTRGAIAGLLIGFVYFLFIRQKKKQNRGLLIGISLMIIGGILFIPIVNPDLTTEVNSQMGSIINRYMQARSLGGRMFIWANTLRNWAENPIFGWGTQRDAVYGFHAPLGSHSGYLGILYKQGIVGLMIYMGILLSIFRQIRKSKASSEDDSNIKTFINFATFAFTANAVNQFSEFMALDAITNHMLWLVYGMIIATGNMIKDSD